MRRRTFLAGTMASHLWLAPSYAQRANPHIATLRSFLKLPDAQVDFAKVKLSIDQMIDPKADLVWATRQLDQITASVTNMITQKFFMRRVAAADKVDALRAYLYLAGTWNGNRVFKYDLENDPTGKTILANKLVPNYLRTRLGNCVSMPALFLILAQKLGVDAALSTAPEHYFVKYRDETGTYHNLETTHDGGLKRDASYVREFEISPKAMENRLYLQPLSPKQTIIAMAGSLAEHYYDKKNVPGLGALADMMLEFQPNCLEGILTKMSSYGAMLDLRYRSKYARFENIPPEEQEGAATLMRQIRTWEQKAEALGWHRPSKEFEAAYQRVVQGAKPKQ